MKTFLLKKEEVKRTWYHFDAANAPLGRLAEKVTKILMGKNKPDYTPHVDSGDFVVVTNIAQVAFGGNKETEKVYYRHSGFIGGLKKATVKEIREKKPEYLLRHAIKGMLPKNRLAAKRLKRLKIYADASHPHKAQNVQTVKF